MSFTSKMASPDSLGRQGIKEIAEDENDKVNRIRPCISIVHSKCIWYLCQMYIHVSVFSKSMYVFKVSLLQS